MYVRVDDISKSPGLWKEFEYTGPIKLQGLTLPGDIDLNLRVTNAGSRILVQGTLVAPVELACSRCAEEFAKRLEIEVDDSFVPEDSPEAPRGSDTLESLSVLTYKDDRVVLDELLRQEIVAASPMQPVCKPDCKGLCDRCGANLNEGACRCEAEDIDPRWGPLLKLRQQGTD